MRSRKYIAICVIMLVASVSLIMPVFATTGSSSGLGGFFFDSVYGILDGIGGIMRDIGNVIADFFRSLISAIKKLGNALLYGISKIIEGIGKAFSFLLSGLKQLFIPSKESFARFRDDIISAFNGKMGNIFSALAYLKTRFSGLSAMSGLRDSFKIAFPQGSFMHGMTIDLLVAPYDVIMFVRTCLTGLYCLVTGMIIYNKAIAMVNR